MCRPFFADGVILIEGNAEQNLVPLFLDKKTKEKNRDYFISLFSISGAYAHIYFNLLNILEIPSLVITDLDLKRDKDDFKDVENLDNRETTNQTLITALEGPCLDKYKSTLIILGNIAVSCQFKIANKFPTSFEEALILTNYNNITLNKCLSNVQPNNYRKIVGECFDEKTFNKSEKKLEKNISESLTWQKKLGENKAEFSIFLCYELLVNEDSDFKIPNYINTGIEWLIDQIKA